MTNDNDDVLALIVQAGQEGVSKPLDDRCALCLRHRLLGIHGIIKDDVVAAQAGECASRGGGEPVSTLGSDSLKLGVLSQIRMPGKILRYQLEVMTALQSLACLMARSAEYLTQTILELGSCPRRNAGNATEIVIDLR
jgi:hypothetical protein